nr:hypothetical protein [Gammaproteobacteria bacterium]
TRFSLHVSALGEGSTEAKLLNERWRSNPDATEVWIELIEALAEDGQLREATACLEAQEARCLTLLGTLEGLKHPNEPQRQPVKQLSEEYHRQVDPLKDRAFVGALKDPEKGDSLKVRLDLLKAIECTTRSLSIQYTELQHTVAQRKQMEGERRVLAEEQGAVDGVLPTLASRFAEVQLILPHKNGLGIMRTDEPIQTQKVLYNQ